MIAAAGFAAVPRLARAAGGDVSVAYAGSLVSVMEKSIGPAFAATGYAYKGEGKGSVALANLIRDGLRTPDVFISADPSVIDGLRGAAGKDTARWYASFAATRMVLGYSRKSKFADAFAAAATGKRPWYDVLQSPGLRTARTDPAQDPKGYRVLQLVQLAEGFYHQPGLSQKLLGDARNPEQVIPEEDALSRLDIGEVDAIWLYSTEALSRAIPFVEFPPQINLGDPQFAAAYARAVVEINGTKRTGAPILYALTVPTNAQNAAGGAAFVAFLLGDQGRALMQRAGLAPVKSIVGGDRNAIPLSLKGVL